MSSKLFRPVVLICLTTILGCGLKIGEKNPDQKVAEVKSAQCLNQAVSDLKVFFAGAATDDQVTSAVVCLQDVFVAFKENIRGEDKNSFTAKEIATFVELNFLKDSPTKFTDDFLNQVMIFKVALFGGNKELVLKSEIDLIVNSIALFKPDLIRLNPHMKILTKNWQEQYFIFEDSQKEKQFLEAKSEFTRLVKKLCAEFAKGKRSYRIDDVFGFIIESARFAKTEESTIQTIQKAQPFLKKFKSYLIGGNSSLQGNEWEKMGLTLTEAYFQNLRFEYFLKALKPEQIEERWVIYEKVASDFSSLIENLLKTKETQSLTNAEIDDLLQPLSEIFPDVSLSEELLNELGDIKIMILGESPIGRRGWDRSDFAELNKKLPTLFKNLSILVQTIDYLAIDKDHLFRQKVNYEDFQNAEIKILAAVSNLSELIERSYNLESLRGLILNLANGPFKNAIKLPDNFDSLFDVFISIKTSLTGQTSTILTVNNIKLLMNVGTRAYLNYSEYDLFLSQYNLDTPEFMSGLTKIWPKIKTTIKIELYLKPENAITTSEFTQLFLELQKENFVKTHIQKASLDLLFDSLWSNILNKPEDRLNQIQRKGFDLVALSELSNEVDRWVGTQSHIVQIFEQNPEWSKNELLPELDQRIKTEPNENTQKGLTEIRNFISEEIPLTFTEEGFLRILDLPSGLYHRSDLSKSNFSRALARMIIRSYANDIARIEPLPIGVLKEEVQVAYDQLKPLAVDLNFVDPGNMGFINARFLESSLFLSISNGDKIAQLSELHHLIMHIFSGIERSVDLRKDISNECLTPLGLFGVQTQVDEDCLLKIYFKNNYSFKGLPQFLNMRLQNSVTDLHDYYFNLLKATGHIPNEQKTVLLSDADLFPHVVQYVEMMYARHDLNRDNLLQKEEALAAFPIFKDLLRELAKPYPLVKEEYLPGVFIYILKYGSAPTSGPDKFKFILFVSDKDQKNWTINSSRLDVGKIFNYIADSTKPKPTP